MDIMEILNNVAIGDEGMERLLLVTNVPLHGITPETSAFAVVDMLLRHEKRVSAVRIARIATDNILSINQCLERFVF